MAALTTAARLAPSLTDRVMHRDEALAVTIARRPLGDLLETVQLVRGGAPLHFLLAKLVAELGGGLAATRAISVVFAVIAVVGVALLARALTTGLEGALCAWAIALSPVALYYGQFARMYSMFLALSALALWVLVRAIDSRQPRYWWLTAALLTLDVYTHPYGVLVAVIAALGAGAALARSPRREWRAPLIAAGAALAAVLPLAVGYLVLASRFQAERGTSGRELPGPSRVSTIEQAFAHFVGVSRHGTAAYIYLALCLVLGAAGFASLARRRPVLMIAWLVLPLVTFAIVKVPGTDNHVRYVIDLLPLVVICVIHGAAQLGRALEWRVVTVAVGVLLVSVCAIRGARIADYRYRPPLRGLQATPSLKGDVSYLRTAFARDDLMLGYDPAFAYGVISPGHNAALASARAVARSEPQLVTRALNHIDEPIAHGWYTVVATDAARVAGFRRELTAHGFDVRWTARRWLLVRTQGAVTTRRAFLERGIEVFTTATHTLRPSEAAAADTTLNALRGSLGAFPVS